MSRLFLYFFLSALLLFPASFSEAQVSRAIQQRREGTTASQPASTPSAVPVSQPSQTPAPSTVPAGVDASPLSFYREQFISMQRIGVVFDKPYMQMIEKDPSKADVLYNEAMKNAKWPTEITQKQIIALHQETFKDIEKISGIPVKVMNEQMKNPETDAQRAHRMKIMQRSMEMMGNPYVPVEAVP